MSITKWSSLNRVTIIRHHQQHTGKKKNRIVIELHKRNYGILFWKSLYVFKKCIEHKSCVFFLLKMPIFTLFWTFCLINQWVCNNWTKTTLLKSILCVFIIIYTVCYLYLIGTCYRSLKCTNINVHVHCYRARSWKTAWIPYKSRLHNRATVYLNCFYLIKYLG